MIVAFDVTDKVVSISWRTRDNRQGRATITDRKASEVLVPTLMHLRQEQQETISALGVVTGPGSFTGIRVGIAAARGLGISLGIPVLGFTKPDLVAAFLGKGHHRLALPAGRRQVMLFELKDGRPIGEPTLEAPESIAAGTLLTVVGEVQGLSGGSLPMALTDLVLERMAQGATEADHPLEPSYVRPPDARKGTSLIDRLLSRG